MSQTEVKNRKMEVPASSYVSVQRVPTIRDVGEMIELILKRIPTEFHKGLYQINDSMRAN